MASVVSAPTRGVPSAGVGALLILLYAGFDLSVIGIIGIILLIGIVKKNGIMLVDFAIQAEREGASPHDAIREAALLRFRPILMTTIAALLECEVNDLYDDETLRAASEAARAAVAAKGAADARALAAGK